MAEFDRPLTSRGSSFVDFFKFRGSSNSRQKGRGGPLLGYVLTVNFVMGAGMFPLPSALHQAGMFLGVTFCFIAAFLAYLTMSWLVEVQSRHAFLTRKHPNFTRNTNHSNIEDSLNAEVDALNPRPAYAANYSYGTGVQGDESQLFSLEDVAMVEVSVMCETFLGIRWRYVWDVCHFLYNWSAMWLYCTIFASCVNEVVGLVGITGAFQCSVDSDADFTDSCLHAYRWWVVVFAVLILFLSARDWKAMNVIQMFITVIAYSSLVIMIGSSLRASFSQPYSVAPDPAVSTTAPYWYEWTWADFSGFSFLFGTALFSQFCHMGNPLILQQFEPKEKAKTVFGLAFFTCTVLYCILGCFGALYFGGMVNAEVTLNWRPRSGDGQPALTYNPPIAWEWLATIILLFPMLTVAIAYLNYVKTLGTHVLHNVPSAWRHKVRPGELSVICRIVVAIPPLLLALMTRRVKVVAEVIGLLVFWLMLLLPTALQWSSYQLLTDLVGETAAKTPYHSLTGRKEFVVLTAVVSLLFYGYFIFGLIRDLV